MKNYHNLHFKLEDSTTKLIGEKTHHPNTFGQIRGGRPSRVVVQWFQGNFQVVGHALRPGFDFRNGNSLTY